MADPNAPKLQGQEGEVSFTLTIKRAATGEEETYDLVGKVTLPTEPADEEK